MRRFGSLIGSDGTVRLAPTGKLRITYETREPDRADIERCLTCTRPKCGGCWAQHEGRYHKRHVKETEHED